MKPLTIAPNKPVTVALADPEGQFDFDRGTGRYQTTAGETLTLPRPAVVLLNTLDPRPGEEIVIQKHWSGRKSDKVTWTIALSTRAEKARAEAGEPDTLTEQLERSIEQAKTRKAPVAVPTPITRPSKRQPAPESQPRLFDRGTGTHGPAPAPDPAPLILPAAVAGKLRPAVIPWNVAFREVSAWVSKELAGNQLQWSDEAQQAMVCTVLIQEARAGRIGPWERPA